MYNYLQVIKVKNSLLHTNGVDVHCPSIPDVNVFNPLPVVNYILSIHVPGHESFGLSD